MKEGVTATDLVLTVVQMLRQKGVVGKFVEFFGDGLDHLTLADAATIGNMGPEYGATCGFFPIDSETLNYLNMTGREADRIALVEAYAKEQGMFRETGVDHPVFTDTLELDLGDVVPSMAGPKRPEGRQALETVGAKFREAFAAEYKKNPAELDRRYAVEGEDYDLGHGDVAIAAITSCTNTSNPSVLIGAGLVAKKANELGLKQKPWVKTSLAPGSQVVAEYLENSGLQKELDQIGFNLVGFGCTTCIGNSGPLNAPISKTINDKGLIASGVLSGNRNFEGRISPDVQANYLASPPLVVAYALAGTVNIDLTKRADRPGQKRQRRLPEGHLALQQGDPGVHRQIRHARDLREEICRRVQGRRELAGGQGAGRPDLCLGRRLDLCAEPALFRRHGQVRRRSPTSRMRASSACSATRSPPTTSRPAGSIKAQSPAGSYLMDNGVGVADFNQYGTRRGNHEVMMRGTFANIRIRNHMLGENGREGGYTIHYPSKEEMPIYDAAMKYKRRRPSAGHLRRRRIRQRLVARLGGQGHQPARRQGGDRAVLRAHPPLQPGRHGRRAVRAGGRHELAVARPEGRRDGHHRGPRNDVKPRQKVIAKVTYADGSVKDVPLICRVDTADEIGYLNNGGILQTVLRDLAAPDSSIRSGRSSIAVASASAISRAGSHR
jgi:aconitate hydratase